jgi:hypothetical protein
MVRRSRILALFMTLVFFPLAAMASSHREAPAIALDPAADNSDLWAWLKPGTHDRLYIVAAYNPLEEPSGGPNFHKFSDDVLYEVHITRGTTSLADVLTYQIRFKTEPLSRVDVADLTKPPGGGKEFFAQLSGSVGFQRQTYSVTKILNGQVSVIAQDIPVAPPNPGPRTFAVLKQLGVLQTPQTTYNDDFSQEFVRPMGNNGSEGTVFAGPRDDGFYVDLGGIFDLANLRAKGAAQDGVAGFNCHAIALDLPTTVVTVNGQLPTTPSNDSIIGVWASASRRKVTIERANGAPESVGPWVQVSRLGLPLINEAVIGLQDKDKYNRTTPVTDVANFGAYFLNPIIVRDAEAVGIYSALGVDPTPFKSKRTDILDIISLKQNGYTVSAIGDVLRVDLTTDSGFPNGRVIYGGTNHEDDVTDVLLSVLLTKATSGISDGVDHNDATYLTRSPWLAKPWSGFDQGHGKPTP